MARAAKYVRVLCGLCVALLVAGRVEASEERLHTYTVAGMRAVPYYAARGEARWDIDLFDPRLVYWNVAFGEADCTDCFPEIPRGTQVTIVEVKVTRAESETTYLRHDPTLVFEANARDTQRQLTLQRVHLGSVSDSTNDTWTIPFVVHGTGCEVLDISVTLFWEGKALGPADQKSIPFRCGE